jgi:hypothetical protein
MESTAIGSVSLVTAPSGQIHSAIAAIMKEVGGIGKTRANTQQNYKFRGIADVTLACQPLMAKHGVHVAPYRVVADTLYERTTKSGGFNAHVRQRIEFRFYHSDGSFVSCETTGEAMDTGDKASNKAMAAALKYALTVTFCIPEEDPEMDTEAHSPEVAGPKAQLAVVKSSPSVASAGTSTPAPAATPTAPKGEKTSPNAGHPAVEQAKAIFGLQDQERQMRCRDLATKPAPDGLGWAVPHLKNHLRKNYPYNTEGLITALKAEDCAEFEAYLRAELAKTKGGK